VLAAHVGVAFATEVVHRWLHIPQLKRSLVRSVQVDPQSVGVGAEHPEAHECMFPDPEQSGVPAPHFVPHAPQLLVVLICVSHPWSGPPSVQCA
jgi:hypothetical protein